MNKNIKTEFAIAIIAGVAFLAAVLIHEKGYYRPKTSFTSVSTKNKSAVSNSQLAANKTSTAHMDEEKIFWPKNFAMSVLPNWQEVSAEDLTLPKGMDGVQFAYQRKNTDCVFAYLHTPASSIKNYDQTSFANRVFTKSSEQLDASWYLNKQDIPENFQFQWEGKQPFPKEVRINYFPTFYNEPGSDFSNVFVLYSANGSVVSDSCNRDVNSMLGSLSPKFENAKISPDSNGVAYIDGPGSKKAYLKFIPEEDGIAKIVAELNIETSPPPTVFQEKLYFVSNGDLKMMDVFSGKIEIVLDKKSAGGQVVNDYFFSNGEIYYLFGKNCKDYMAECDLSLYEYDVASRKSQKLAEKLPYRDIFGYSQEKNILYFIYSEGDAGCASAKTGGYDFEKHGIVEKKEFSGCNDELSSMNSKLAKLKKTLSSQPVMFESIPIKNGVIATPKLEMDITGKWQTIRYAE